MVRALDSARSSLGSTTTTLTVPLSTQEYKWVQERVQVYSIIASFCMISFKVISQQVGNVTRQPSHSTRSIL